MSKRCKKKKKRLWSNFYQGCQTLWGPKLFSLIFSMPVNRTLVFLFGNAFSVLEKLLFWKLWYIGTSLFPFLHKNFSCEIIFMFVSYPILAVVMHQVVNQFILNTNLLSHPSITWNIKIAAQVSLVYCEWPHQKLLCQ